MVAVVYRDRPFDGQLEAWWRDDDQHWLGLVKFYDAVNGQARHRWFHTTDIVGALAPSA